MNTLSHTTTGPSWLNAIRDTFERVIDYTERHSNSVVVRPWRSVSSQCRMKNWPGSDSGATRSAPTRSPVISTENAAGSGVGPAGGQSWAA
jgi:hypothetical protein